MVLPACTLAISAFYFISIVGTFEFIKKALRSKTLVHALIIGCIIQILSVICGLGIIVAYTSTLLKMIGFSLKEAIWFATLPAFLNLTMKGVSAFFIDKIGRRKLFLISGTFVILSLGLLSTSLFLGNSHSALAVPLNEGGKCDYSNCGTYVANSHCGFCTINVNGEYLYGTCSEGSMDGDDFSDNSTQCIISNETINLMNNTSNTSEWYFDHCPGNKFAIFSLVAVMLLATSTSSGFVALPWIINSEIYPTWVRSQAASLSSLFNWFTNIILLFTFLSTIDALGLSQVIVMYAVSSFIGLIFVFLFLPETSNEPLEKIERLFDKPYFLIWCDSHTCRNRKRTIKYSVVEVHKQDEAFELT